jgi:hypothetical protein
LSNLTAAVTLATLVAWSNVAAPASKLPDPQLTPGATNAAIPEERYLLLCHSKNWTRPHRPPVGFTKSLKRRQMEESGYPLADIHAYEEDHLVPLCLAGAPQDPSNLWPQPLFGEWSAVRKDALESKLCRLACEGKVRLEDAQREIAADWIAAYEKYIGEREPWKSEN